MYNPTLSAIDNMIEEMEQDDHIMLAIAMKEADQGNITALETIIKNTNLMLERNGKKIFK